MLIGYARVSTQQQDLAAQREALTNLGVEPDRVYVDHGLTGITRDRPGLREAMAACRRGDSLAVSKLDRLARSVRDAHDIAAELAERGVRLQLGASVYDPLDPMGKLMFNVLAMVAEFEADLIRARTRGDGCGSREGTTQGQVAEADVTSGSAPCRPSPSGWPHRGGAGRAVQRRSQHRLPRRRTSGQGDCSGSSWRAPGRHPPGARSKSNRCSAITAIIGHRHAIPAASLHGGRTMTAGSSGARPTALSGEGPDKELRFC